MEDECLLTPPFVVLRHQSHSKDNKPPQFMKALSGPIDVPIGGYKWELKPVKIEAMQLD
jgi:hypothetical protein